MGSYSELLIGEYPILSEKNSYNLYASSLIFTKDDYITEKRPNSSRSELVWGKEVREQKGKYTFKGFSQKAKVCKDRLEILGVNLKSAEKDFNAAKKLAKEEIYYDFPIQKAKYKEYLNEIKDIMQRREINYDTMHSNLRDSLILDGLYIVGQSIPQFLYSVLQCIDNDQMIEYDLSEIISSGWIKEDLEGDLNISGLNEKIIILTEGRTDVEFISKSIKKLYPHLAERYHFLDFDEYKVETNASALAKLIISFAAAGVKHQIIGLFDNDTTGLKEMSKVCSYALPDNIKVLKYPDIAFAKKYPTIGASGKKKMNVNSLACSIEMYLGADVLVKDGNIIPVYWKSYDDKLRKYQGEILEKAYVQNAFREKLNRNEIGDFSDMDQILKMIFTAFQI